ncbi:MAG: GTPase Era [Burkholderiaceae bacterium]|nr:GTPase Era [Burkholderiaceae bacterium]
MFRCGTVALVGRPNVGKSTLLNRLVGQKLSITSDRPQTTRHRIVGVVHRPEAQLLFLDSPGYQTRVGGPMNRVLNRTSMQVAQDADVVVLVCDARNWTATDARLAQALPADRPVLLAMNKIDLVKDKERLLPAIARARQARDFDEIVPVSARSGRQVDVLVEACAKRLPEGPPAYDADALTDRSERFLAAETIREKLFRQLGDELPYESTVEIERFEELPGLRRIHAAIVVARDAQRPIVIGARGERIKRIATEARLDLERLFGTKVFLELFVKVKSGWAGSEQSLRSYGYE